MSIATFTSGIVPSRTGEYSLQYTITYPNKNVVNVTVTHKDKELLESTRTMINRTIYQNNESITSSKELSRIIKKIEGEEGVKYKNIRILHKFLKCVKNEESRSQDRLKYMDNIFKYANAICYTNKYLDKQFQYKYLGESNVQAKKFIFSAIALKKFQEALKEIKNNPNSEKAWGNFYGRLILYQNEEGVNFLSNQLKVSEYQNLQKVLKDGINLFEKIGSNVASPDAGKEKAGEMVKNLSRFQKKLSPLPSAPLEHMTLPPLPSSLPKPTKGHRPLPPRHRPQPPQRPQQPLDPSLLPVASQTQKKSNLKSGEKPKRRVKWQSPHAKVFTQEDSPDRVGLTNSVELSWNDEVRPKKT